MTRSAPNHGPPGLFELIQTSKTFSGDAGMVRETVRSVRFIVVSPFLWRKIARADRDGCSKIVRISEPSALRRAAVQGATRECCRGRGVCGGRARLVPAPGRAFGSRCGSWGKVKHSPEGG